MKIQEVSEEVTKGGILFPSSKTSIKVNKIDNSAPELTQKRQGTQEGAIGARK